MSLKIGKRDVQAIVPVLDAEYESVEDAAAALIAAAFDLYESKAKWTVVGQLRRHKVDGLLDPAESAASKIALGRYATETQAMGDAEKLVYSNATGEEFRAWVLPTWHGTPSKFHSERKTALRVDDLGPTPADKLSHVLAWARENPDLDRSQYPGPPTPDPRSDCPICGADPEEG